MNAGAIREDNKDQSNGNGYRISYLITFLSLWQDVHSVRTIYQYVIPVAFFQ